MMVVLPKPAALRGDQLADELVAAGFAGVTVTDEADGTIAVRGTDDEDGVRQVVEAHVPADPGPDPDDEWRDAIRSASTLADLKAVLAGDSSTPGRAERRPPSG